MWVAKGRSTWLGGVVQAFVQSIAVEWPLLKVQQSVVSQDDEWQVPVAAVIGPHNLTGWSQSFRIFRPALPPIRARPGLPIREVTGS